MRPSPIRVASRYLLSKLDLAKALADAEKQYAATGDPSEVLKVFQSFRSVVGMDDTGSSIRIHGEWFYAQAKPSQGRVVKMIQAVRGLERHLRDQPDKDRQSVVAALQVLRGSFKWLTGQFKDTDDEVKHGPWVLVKMPGVSGKAMTGAIQALDEATRLVSKRFPQVTYGKVFVSERLSGANTLALYTFDGDVVYLSLRARNSVGDVYAIIHELGHRYFKKFWNDAKAKDQFRRLSTETAYETVVYTPKQKDALAKDLLAQVVSRKKGGKPKAAPALDDYLEHFQPIDLSDLKDLVRGATQGGAKEAKALVDGFLRMGPDSIQTDKVIREPLAVTSYGKTSWEENFSEAFAHYLMGKPLPDELQKIMDNLS